MDIWTSGARAGDHRRMKRSMRRFALALLILSCAAGPAVPARTEVAVESPPPPPPGASVAPCVVSGSGETRTSAAWRTELVLHEEKTKDSPIVHVVTPDVVGGTWSEFPPAERSGRAHLVIGGGPTPAARIGGWTPLEGRVFQTRRDTIVVRDHVWMFGTEVVLRGTEPHTGRLTVTRPTLGLTTPDTAVASAACDDLAYERDRIDPEISVVLPPATKQAVDGTVKLRPAPGGSVVYTITRSSGARLVLAVAEERDGWLRVLGAVDVLRFDGWIPSNEAVPLNGGAAGRLGGSHITRPPTVHFGRSMMVAKETPLLLGHDADDARAIGVLEVQAKLDVIGNGKRASIRFSPRVLAAPEGLTFFADDADLAVVPP